MSRRLLSGTSRDVRLRAVPRPRVRATALAVPPVLIDLLGSIVFALLVPYVAIGRTLLYFDLEVSEREEAAEPSKPRRRWLSRLRPTPQTG
jgi:hypothetical protein